MRSSRTGAATLIAPRVIAKMRHWTWADARAIVAALDFAYGEDDGTTTWGLLRASDAEYARGKRLWRELTARRP